MKALKFPLLFTLGLTGLIVFPFVDCSSQILSKPLYSEVLRLDSTLKEVNVRSFMGDIRVIPHFENNIRIEVWVENPDTDSEIMRDFREFHALGISQRGDQIIVDNLIADAPSMWWRTIGSSLMDSGIQISIELYLPDYLKLDVDQRNGKLWLNNHSGDLNLHLQSVNLEAGQLTGNSSFTLDHSSMKVQYTGSTIIYSSHSEVFIGSTNHTEINSTNSIVEILQSEFLKIASAYDRKISMHYGKSALIESAYSNIEVFMADSLLINSSLRDTVNIQGIKDYCLIQCEGSKISLKTASINTTGLKLEADDSKILINIRKSLAYSIDLTMDRNTKIDIPVCDKDPESSPFPFFTNCDGKGRFDVTASLKGGSFKVQVSD